MVRRLKTHPVSPLRAALAAVFAALLLALCAAPANAGRLLATGHDVDLHCAPGPPASDACSLMRAAITYVRDTAPDLTRPVLIVDRPPSQAKAALSLFQIPYVLVTPDALPAKIDTATYSAVVVASDSSCVGCDLNPQPGAPDSAALRAVAPALLRFFNDGGGLLALAGAANAGVYYDFLPLPVGGQAAATPPYTPNPFGASIGLTAANTNCCIAHNSFAPASTLTIAETDAQGRAETVVAEGIVGAGATLSPLPAAPAGIDHFKCYTVASTRARTRSLRVQDRFGTQTVSLRSARQLCNPAAKTAGGTTNAVRNPRAHLACYASAASADPPAPRFVRLRNQFGTAATQTTGAQTLCVPSRVPAGADPERALDHMRCYGVTPRAVRQSVRLRDRFGRTSTRVARLVRLCNPAQRTLRGVTRKVARPAASLACYAIRDTSRLRARGVIVRNALERRRLRATRAETLCLPTFAQVLGVRGEGPSVAPAPIQAPAQFVMDLAARSCAGPSGFVHTLTGRTQPAKEAGLTTTLSGPGLTPVTQTGRVAADGTFTASATTTPTPGVYRWTAVVAPPDGGEFSGVVEVNLSTGAGPC